LSTLKNFNSVSIKQLIRGRLRSYRCLINLCLY